MLGKVTFIAPLAGSLHPGQVVTPAVSVFLGERIGSSSLDETGLGDSDVCGAVCGCEADHYIERVVPVRLALTEGE